MKRKNLANSAASMISKKKWRNNFWKICQYLCITYLKCFRKQSWRKKITHDDGAGGDGGDGICFVLVFFQAQVGTQQWQVSFCLLSTHFVPGGEKENN